MTPIDLIRLSLKTAGVEGVGQTPDAEDTNDCFTVLNAMMGSWSRKRWLVYNLVETTFISNGSTSYTIGSGGNFNIPRPDKIETAYARLFPVSLSGPVDFNLHVIEAAEDYANITMKQLHSFPTAVFYDGNYPLGNIFVYPIPSSTQQFEIHLVVKNTLSQFATLTTPISLPPEYTDALIWNLAVRIRPLFGLGPDPILIGLAVMSLNVLRQANGKIPTMSMPIGIPGGNGGRYLGHGIPSYGMIN